MICMNCGEPIAHRGQHLNQTDELHWNTFYCSPKAERSEAPQACPPSANSSAGARADALPDSPIGSDVPREYSGLEAMLTKWRERRIRKYHEASIKAREGDYGYALQRTAEAEAIEVCIKDLEDELPTDAHQRSGERALARND